MHCIPRLFVGGPFNDRRRMVLHLGRIPRRGRINVRLARVRAGRSQSRQLLFFAGLRGVLCRAKDIMAWLGTLWVSPLNPGRNVMDRVWKRDCSSESKSKLERATRPA